MQIIPREIPMCDTPRHWQYHYPSWSQWNSRHMANKQYTTVTTTVCVSWCGRVCVERVFLWGFMQPIGRQHGLTSHYLVLYFEKFQANGLLLEKNGNTRMCPRGHAKVCRSKHRDFCLLTWPPADRQTQKSLYMFVQMIMTFLMTFVFFSFLF